MTANNAANLSPVLSSEFNELMAAIGYFESNPDIAVATSGGADSMALLLLARDWVTAGNGKVVSLTVNHNLRPEAANEAIQVGQWCKELDIEHHILCWEHSSPRLSAIQASAREVRYKLMTQYCRENNILHLLTAHHLDDQVETLFFRLARGSLLEGLSAMPAQTVVSGVRLLRPLLQVQKSRLVATLKDRGQKWLEDPSNNNHLYTRVYIRSQLAKIPDETAIKQKAGCTINIFGKFRNLLENKLAGKMISSVEIHPQGYALINVDEFNRLDREFSIKALNALIQTISGSPHPPRSEKTVSLHNAIYTRQFNKKRSLGGLLFEPISKYKQQILVYREGKAVAKPIIIPENTPVLWDKRFLVEWSGDGIYSPVPISLELRTLGIGGLAYIKQYAPSLLRNAPPARILRTLPSLWLLEKLVSVPHIHYMNMDMDKNQTVPSIKSTVQFCPAKQLAGSSFFVMNS